MYRQSKGKSLTIAKDAAVSDVLDYGDYGYGVFLMPAAWTAATMCFKVCGTPDGTFLPLYSWLGSVGVLVGFTVTVDVALPLPSQLQGVTYFKFWSTDGSGADQAQAAARTIKVEIKA